MRKKLLLLITVVFCFSFDTYMPVNAKKHNAKVILSETQINVSEKSTRRLILSSSKKLTKKQIKKITWESSNRKIVSIKPNKKNHMIATLFAKKQGTCVLKIKYGRQVISCNIRVNCKELNNSSYESDAKKYINETPDNYNPNPGAENKTPQSTDEHNPTQSTEEHIHTYGEWKNESTNSCTKPGERRRYCKCGAYESQIIPASGHSFDGWKLTQQPSCTNQGVSSRVCKLCGKTETRPIAATGHGPYNYRYHIEAVVEYGVKESTCLKCGYKSVTNGLTYEMVPVSEPVSGTQYMNESIYTYFKIMDSMLSYSISVYSYQYHKNIDYDITLMDDGVTTQAMIGSSVDDSIVRRTINGTDVFSLFENTRYDVKQNNPSFIAHNTSHKRIEYASADALYNFAIEAVRRYNGSAIKSTNSIKLYTRSRKYRMDLH